MSFSARIKPTDAIKGSFLDDFLIKMEMHMRHVEDHMAKGEQPPPIAADVELSITAPTFNQSIHRLFQHVVDSVTSNIDEYKMNGLSSKTLVDKIKEKTGAGTFENIFAGRVDFEDKTANAAIYHGFHQIWEYFLQSYALGANRQDYVDELKGDKRKGAIKIANDHSQKNKCPLSEGYGMLYLMESELYSKKTRRSPSDTYFESAISMVLRRFKEYVELENQHELGSPSDPQYKVKLEELIDTKLRQISEKTGFTLPKSAIGKV